MNSADLEEIWPQVPLTIVKYHSWNKTKVKIHKVMENLFFIMGKQLTLRSSLVCVIPLIIHIDLSKLM